VNNGGEDEVLGRDGGAAERPAVCTVPRWRTGHFGELHVPARLLRDRNYMFAGDTMTNGASHVHPNSAKGQLQREGREKLARAKVGTASSGLGFSTRVGGRMRPRRSVWSSSALAIWCCPCMA
jgi:hypothetical protein